MTLRVRGRGVQTALQMMSSVVLRRESPCEPKTFRGRDPRREIEAWLGNREMNDALRQEISVLELSQACHTLFLHKIGDSTRISCTF